MRERAQRQERVFFQGGNGLWPERQLPSIRSAKFMEFRGFTPVSFQSLRLLHAPASSSGAGLSFNTPRPYVALAQGPTAHSPGALQRLSLLLLPSRMPRLTACIHTSSKRTRPGRTSCAADRPSPIGVCAPSSAPPSSRQRMGSPPPAPASPLLGGLEMTGVSRLERRRHETSRDARKRGVASPLESEGPSPASSLYQAQLTSGPHPHARCAPPEGNRRCPGRE
jgi:hypothetical protein